MDAAENALDSRTAFCHFASRRLHPVIEIKALKKSDWKRFGARLQELESAAEYPYGADFFRLNHGANYFAFFERMGEPLFHIALDENRVIACAAGILRTLVIGNETIKAWYLCDLKIHPEFRWERPAWDPRFPFGWDRRASRG